MNVALTQQGVKEGRKRRRKTVPRIRKLMDLIGPMFHFLHHLSSHYLEQKQSIMGQNIRKLGKTKPLCNIHPPESWKCFWAGMVSYLLGLAPWFNFCAGHCLCYCLGFLPQSKNVMVASLSSTFIGSTVCISCTAVKGTLHCTFTQSRDDILFPL